MDLFWKSAAAVLITVVIALTLGKWESNITLMLSVAVCSMVSMIAVSFLEPVMDLFRQLSAMSGLGKNTLTILLKILGIGFVTEIVSLICTDSGNSSLGKIMTFLSSSVVLWLSIPIINQLIDILKQILGAI